MKAVNIPIVHWGLTLCMLCFCCSCSLLQPGTEDRATKQVVYEELPASATNTDSLYYSHVVKWQGESLSRISMWYTGSVKNWLTLQEINSAINPKQMKIGDIVLIPEDLIKTREPMPKEFRGTNNKVKRKPAPEAVTELSPERAEPQLFGPIDTQTEEKEDPEESGLSLSLETID